MNFMYLDTAVVVVVVVVGCTLGLVNNIVNIIMIMNNINTTFFFPRDD